MSTENNGHNPYANNGGSNYGQRRPIRPKAVGKTAGIIAALVFALIIVLNSVYSLTENQNAVVTTLGNPSAVTTSGIHFAIPFIQKVHIVDMTVHGLAIGYDEKTDASIEYESLMITSDFNFLDVSCYIEYAVSDPIKYLYNAQEPEDILKMLAQSYIRDTVGLYAVDEVLTTGRYEIQAAVSTKLTQRLEAEDIGLQIKNVTIQDVDTPTSEVKAAFDAVETAKQNADTLVNEANQYRAEQLPAAEAEADKVLQEAEAQKEARINEANGQVARFNALYSEYVKFPVITKQRMYFETMEELLPQMQIIITDGEGETLNIFNNDIGNQ
ncbi:MAG: FtsH protease activity modulator HflK [Lachnospiraceae bacterium]|nr:FtsH protease activity modulator HflK [Lachnospiraceae bacterium]